MTIFDLPPELLWRIMERAVETEPRVYAATATLLHWRTVCHHHCRTDDDELWKLALAALRPRGPAHHGGVKQLVLRAHNDMARAREMGMPCHWLDFDRADPKALALVHGRLVRRNLHALVSLYRLPANSIDANGPHAIDDEREQSRLNGAFVRAHASSVDAMRAALADPRAEHDLFVAGPYSVLNSLIQTPNAAVGCVHLLVEQSVLPDDTTYALLPMSVPPPVMRALVGLFPGMRDKTSCGEAPLHRAAYFLRPEAVETLLELGADPFQKSGLGLTPRRELARRLREMLIAPNVKMRERVERARALLLAAEHAAGRRDHHLTHARR